MRRSLGEASERGFGKGERGGGVGEQEKRKERRGREKVKQDTRKHILCMHTKVVCFLVKFGEINSPPVYPKQIIPWRSIVKPEGREHIGTCECHGLMLYFS